MGKNQTSLWGKYAVWAIQAPMCRQKKMSCVEYATAEWVCCTTTANSTLCVHFTFWHMGNSVATGWALCTTAETTKSLCKDHPDMKLKCPPKRGLGEWKHFPPKRGLGKWEYEGELFKKCGLNRGVAPYQCGFPPVSSSSVLRRHCTSWLTDVQLLTHTHSTVYLAIPIDPTLKIQNDCPHEGILTAALTA